MPLVTARAPGLLALHGVGPDTAAVLLIAAGDHPGRLRTEAAWAHLFAAAPIPASSGKISRHRLNRGGDRQASHALWRIVITRLSSHPPTRAYVARRSEEGLSKPEIIRCLKRSAAPGPLTRPAGRDLIRVLVSLRGTPRRRENRGGLPADAERMLVPEAV